MLTCSTVLRGSRCGSWLVEAGVVTTPDESGPVPSEVEEPLAEMEAPCAGGVKWVV
jgi:hypothetical protein